MKTRTHIAAIALLLSMPVVLAQQADHEAHHPAGLPAAEMVAPATTPTMAPATSLESVLAQRLEELQSDWDKISQTQDPAERQKLMEEHRQKLRELSALLRGGILRGTPGGPGMKMMGGGSGMEMMGGGPGGMGMMGGGPGMGMMGGCHAMMRAHQQQVERRLDIIQKLLEQVLEYQIKS
jgi:hypothetical protein